MIFSGNTTALGATTIPMAEGYDCSYGVSLALVESARNDMAMFRALVQSDYKEMAICKESTGIVREGEISALQEAVGGGIFKKIAELFHKLVAKIKSIFHSFIAKLRGLYMKDKDLLKKYKSELLNKNNLDNLEVKWRKYDNNKLKNAASFSNVMAKFEADSGWSSDTWERVNYYIKKNNNLSADANNDFIEKSINDIFGDAETVKLKEIGGIVAIINFIDGHSSKISSMETQIKKATDTLANEVKKYKNAIGPAADKVYNDYKDAKDNNKDVPTDSSDKLKSANQTYDMAKAYQTYMLMEMGIATKTNTIAYKQNKAALIKAIAVNEKKLEESTILLDAIAEAAEEEVENVIQTALSDEEISKLSAASTNVKDGDVSDDPDKLTYGPDCYTTSASFSDAEGTVDTCIGDGKVEESAYFGKMFY